MTMSLTFPATGRDAPSRADAGRPPVLQCAVVLATAVLVAIAAPVSATLGASASGESRGAASFTGEFVNGAPVYRLPTITVVGRRGVLIGVREDLRKKKPRRMTGLNVRATQPLN